MRLPKEEESCAVYRLGEDAVVVLVGNLIEVVTILVERV